MRMDKLTTKFQAALAEAQSLAVGRDHQFIEPEHLLVAMLDQEGGGVRQLLQHAGVNVNYLRSQLGEALDHIAQVEGAAGDVQISNDLGRLLNVTDKLAQKRKDQYISSELFVLALASDDKARAATIVKRAGADKAALEHAIEEVRGGENVSDPNAEDQRQALDKYTIDLTERAEQGKVDPVIGRDDEIRRTVQVLQRRTKNNPVLIGEPGVGKTAIVEGLARRIVEGDVPETLKDKRVVSLDVSARHLHERPGAAPPAAVPSVDGTAAGPVGDARVSAEVVRDVDGAGRPLPVDGYDAPARWSTAAVVASSMMGWLEAAAASVVLNVNVPNVPFDQLAGMQAATLAPFGRVRAAVVESAEHRGRVQMELRPSEEELPVDCDTALVDQGFVAVTALSGIGRDPSVDLSDLLDDVLIGGGRTA